MLWLLLEYLIGKSYNKCKILKYNMYLIIFIEITTFYANNDNSYFEYKLT